MSPRAFSRVTVFLSFLIFILFRLGVEKPALAGPIEENSAKPKSFSYYRPITKRNLFKPLWGKAVFAPAIKIQTNKEKKEISAGLKRLKTDLKLSGIVFNGRCYQAIIESRRKSGNKLFYKEGDIIQGARVVSIDGDKLEVVLDFKGENLTLNLTPAAKKVRESKKSLPPSGSQKNLMPSSKSQIMLKSMRGN
ncbi:MAG: hypothetical protein KAJ66_04760 [Candidatus Omnitrophica bacterium]|nr:hypothetical protein [Candidatus Omnitrophota bacterium]